MFNTAKGILIFTAILSTVLVFFTIFGYLNSLFLYFYSLFGYIGSSCAKISLFSGLTTTFLYLQTIVRGYEKFIK